MSGAGPAARVELIAQLEDVTERKRAEQRARRSGSASRPPEPRPRRSPQMVRNLQSVSDAALAHLALDDLLPELLERIARDPGRRLGLGAAERSGDEGACGLRATRGVATAEAGCAGARWGAAPSRDGWRKGAAADQ